MTKVGKYSQPPYLLMKISILVFLVVTAFFEEGVAYFDPIYTTKMSVIEASLTFVLCLVLALIVLLLSKRYFHIKTNWPFLLILLLLFATDVVAICVFPELSVETSVYHVTKLGKMVFLFYWFAACVAFYIFFAIMPKTVTTRSGWNVYFIGGLFIALVGCVFSYIFESQAYTDIFNGSAGSIYDLDYQIVSFTNNKNTYGTLLVIGLVCSLYLHKNTRQWWWLLFSVFLFLNIIIVSSRASFLISVLLILSYLILDFCLSVKSHPIVQILKISLIASCIVFLFLLKPLGLSEKSHFFEVINLVVERSFTQGLESFNTRVRFWQLTNKMVFSTPTSAIFGFGDWNFSWYLSCLSGAASAQIESAHNGFADVLGRSGLIGVTVYVALLVYFVVLLIKCINRKQYWISFSFFVFLAVIIHGVFEDTNFLNMQAKDMMFLFLAYMPVLTEYQLSKKTTDDKETAFKASSTVNKPQKRWLSPSSWSALSLALATPLFAIALGLAPFFSHYGGVTIFGNTYFFIQTGCVYVCLPFVAYGLASLRQNGHSSIHGVLLPLFVIYALADLVVCLFGVANLVTVIAFAIISFFFAIVCMIKADKTGIKKLFVSSIIYFVIEAVLIATSQLVVRYCLFPDDAYQPYAMMVLILIDFAVVALFAFASPLSDLLFIPYDDWWIGVETWYYYACLRVDTKYEIRQIKATKRKVRFRDM